MKKKKFLILSIVIIIIVLIALVFILNWSDIAFNYSMINFSRLIEKDRKDNLSLIIIYRNSNVLAPYPYSVDEMIYSGGSNIISIHGSDLGDYQESLSVLGDLDITVTEPKTHFDASIYYVFKNRSRTVFEVAMWGGGEQHYMIVNGVEVEENDYLYDFVRQFLPEETAREFDEYIGLFNNP